MAGRILASTSTRRTATGSPSRTTTRQADRSRTAGWAWWVDCSYPTTATPGPPPIPTTRSIKWTTGTTCDSPAATGWRWAGWRCPCSRAAASPQRTITTDAPADVVLLDFGGTLDADGVHWSPRFHAAYGAAGGTLDLPAFAPIFKSSDQPLDHLPGIAQPGFRAAIEAQARLLVELLPEGARVDPAAVARRLHDDAVAVARRNEPGLERLPRPLPVGGWVCLHA